MALTRPFGAFLLFLLFLFAGNRVFPQSVLLAAEIEAVEKKLSDTKLSSGERKSALVHMARLFELSGNFEGAAEAWKEAARAGDTGALLRGARCLAAIGEFEKAEQDIRPALGSQNPWLSAEARVLVSQLEALRTGRTDALGALLADPEFSAYKPGIYYSIWKISGDDSVRNRLMGEFPQSPEGRIAEDSKRSAGNNAPPVSAAPSALWLLMGVRPQPEPAPGRNTAPVPARTASTSPETAVPGGSSMLQTGLFGREDNALAMAERLRKAGFTPVITQKTINGRDYWAVGAVPGADASRTILLLKDRGFESFPVY
jgi:cell division septation protein DedD